MHYFYIIRYDTHGLPLFGEAVLLDDTVRDPFAVALAVAVPVWARLSC
jgi:hypothetical protein